MFGFTRAQIKRNTHYSRSEDEIQLELGGDYPLNIHLFIAGYLHSMILAVQQNRGPRPTRHYMENKTCRTEQKYKEENIFAENKSFLRTRGSLGTEGSILWASKRDPTPRLTGDSSSSQYQIKASTNCFAESIFLLTNHNHQSRNEGSVFPRCNLGTAPVNISRQDNSQNSTGGGKGTAFATKII